MKNPTVTVSLDGVELIKYGLWEIAILLLKPESLESWSRLKVYLEGEEVSSPEYMNPKIPSIINPPKIKRRRGKNEISL